MVSWWIGRLVQVGRLGLVLVGWLVGRSVGQSVLTLVSRCAGVVLMYLGLLSSVSTCATV